MFNLDIDYLIINIILLLSFMLSGERIAKGKNYWGWSTLSIITFSLAMGLRWKRGNDYLHYQDIYLYDLESQQFIFTKFNDFLKFIGINEYGFFFCYALVFIVCAFIFLKPHRKYAQYLFPIFLMAFIVFEEYVIRQALSFSFVFLFINELIVLRDNTSQHRHKLTSIFLCILYATIAYSIHAANIIILSIIIILYFTLKRDIPPIISIPLYLFATYFFAKYVDLSFLEPIVSFLGNSNDKFSSYADNSDYWFSTEGFNDIYSRNPVIQLLEVFGVSSLMYLGNKVINEKQLPKFYVLTYNIFVFGACFKAAFLNLEILNRIGGCFYRFYFVPLSIVLYHLKFKNLKLFDQICYLTLIIWVYDFLKYLFMRGEMTKFLWDIIPLF